jgi:hypothetical protein
MKPLNLADAGIPEVTSVNPGENRLFVAGDLPLDPMFESIVPYQIFRIPDLSAALCIIRRGAPFNDRDARPFRARRKADSRDPSLGRGSSIGADWHPRHGCFAQFVSELRGRGAIRERRVPYSA